MEPSGGASGGKDAPSAPAVAATSATSDTSLDRRRVSGRSGGWARDVRRRRVAARSANRVDDGDGPQSDTEEDDRQHAEEQDVAREGRGCVLDAEATHATSSGSWSLGADLWELACSTRDARDGPGPSAVAPWSDRGDTAWVLRIRRSCGDDEQRSDRVGRHARRRPRRSLVGLAHVRPGGGRGGDRTAGAGHAGCFERAQDAGGRTDPSDARPRHRARWHRAAAHRRDPRRLVERRIPSDRPRAERVTPCRACAAPA